MRRKLIKDWNSLWEGKKSKAETPIQAMLKARA